jgi:ribosome biogenesis GTPase A
MTGNTFGKAKPQRGKSNTTNKHRQSVAAIIKNLVLNSDIILEVLDARFIDKTRHKEIEKKILQLGKRIIYVFNKADLVTVSQVQKQVDLSVLKPHVFVSARQRRGIVMLRILIKKEAKKAKKDAVNIGILGYPNTGKSSLINALIGKPSAKVSPIAGFTKSIQKIKLAEGLYLIDAPGIIYPEENVPIIHESPMKHSQIGAIDWDKIRDPEMVIDSIIKEYPNALEEHYGIDAKGDAEVLIDGLGRKLNYLRRGGFVDETRTSKQILKDWQYGKIPIGY